MSNVIPFGAVQNRVLECTDEAVIEKGIRQAAASFDETRFALSLVEAPAELSKLAA